MATQSIISLAVHQPNQLRPIPALNPVASQGHGAAFLDEKIVRLGIFQLPWVQNLLPFLTSLALHATFIIIGFLTLQAIRIMKAPPGIEQTIIPDTWFVQQGPPGGVPNVGHGDPFRPAMTFVPDSVMPDFADSKRPAFDLNLAHPDSGDSSDVVIGAGPGGGFSGTGARLGSTSGDSSGALKNFGVPGGGGIGLRSPVFCCGGNARSIVFVCDCTGSMINKLGVLKTELAKSVMSLRPIQSFTVIVYQDEGYRVWQKQLTAATPENKRRFNDWLRDIQSFGSTNPVPAIELGLKLHPRLLYFLTDAADFPDVNAVVGSFRKGNVDKKVKVNTILFVESASEQEWNKESEPLMRQIAKDSGGVFRWVRFDELQ